MEFKRQMTNGTWSAAQEINPLRFEKRVLTESIKGKTLPGRNFNHLKDYRYTYEMFLSADELLNTTKKEFIESLFITKRGKFSTDSFATETEFIVEDDGKMQYELIEDIEAMKEITLVLIEVNAR